MAKKSVDPKDILPDGDDTAVLNGRTVRKGTIAAFIANINLLECETSDKLQKQEALAALKALAPDVIAIGLHKYVTFNNPEAEQILIDAEAGS